MPKVPGKVTDKQGMSLGMAPGISGDCVKCGLCVRKCPVGAIDADTLGLNQIWIKQVIGEFMRYKLIIFDMDGTILDTLEDLTDSLNFALKESGMSERSLSEVRNFVGNGIRKLIERAVPANTPIDIVDRVMADFSEKYRQNCANKTCPYDGITEVLSSLRNRGVQTAVVSNKIDFAVQQLCVQYFDGLFDMAVGEREGVRKKPAPDAIYAVLEHFGIEKKDALYIGDSEVDIQTAANVGMDCICAGWGFREADFLLRNGAAAVLTKPDEILGYILMPVCCCN